MGTATTYYESLFSVADEELATNLIARLDDVLECDARTKGLTTRLVSGGLVQVGHDGGRMGMAVQRLVFEVVLREFHDLCSVNGL